MALSKIASVGISLPAKKITNEDLSQVMNTSDEWITERTGIKTRYYATPGKETTTSLGAKAAEMAIKNAGLQNSDIDFIIFATLSPDYFFPGSGVLLQRMMGMNEIGALDVRNQCSGFIYGLSIADQFIKTGMYKNILVVGSETQTYTIDFSDNGRNVAVIFGDGAGAVVLQPSKDDGHGLLSTHLHSNGNDAELLSMTNPGFHNGYYTNDDAVHDNKKYGGGFVTEKQKQQHDFFPFMDGQAVFKKAVEKFPEVINEALQKNGYTSADIDLLIPHQANIRISQMVQRKLGLKDEQVFNNIHRYGNTTAASIPIALYEALQEGKIKTGDLVCLAAFGSGFTWGSALLKW